MSSIVASLDELEPIAANLNNTLPSDAILFLCGDLGSGKTTLAKAVGKSRGVTASITSPTFSLQHKYDENLYHYDLYRKEFEEIVALGIIEEFEKSGWHMVEWGSDELKQTLLSFGLNCYNIEIESSTPDSRLYTIRKLNA